jgi:hypothetical protein
VVTGSFITTIHLPFFSSRAGFCGKTLHQPGLSAPYIPDLAPCDFWLFPKLKSQLKGKIFQTAHEITENSTRQLMVIPRKDFADCFEQWREY